MDSLDAFVAYDELAIPPLGALGWTVDTVSWCADADWAAYDVVVIRTPWDYQDHPEAFLEVLERIDRSTRLENGLDVVRWNLDKAYLRDLEARGVPIVPTRWLDQLGADALADLFDALGTDEVVVKPSVSANADGTFRLRRGDRDRQLEAVRALAAHTAAGRGVMAQPFVPAVVEEGEYSVFAFAGEVSHAILKTPASGDFRVQEEHGGRIRGVEPAPELAAAADRAFAAVEAAVGQTLLYARADLVRWAGDWVVMEMELIEPSLYFPFGDGSAARFARALDDLVP